MADTKRKLDNDIFATAGIAQKNNCALTRLDYMQEAGFMASVPLGENLIPIQRGLTTSSTAIFIPFITQGRHGTYALIDKNENRNKDIRKPRPSIRAQLQSEKEKAVPKRTAKVKKHDLEV